MKQKNSLLHKQFCEICSKDVSKSYFSKHLQSQGHILRAKNDVKTEEATSEDDLKDLKNIKLSSSESSESEISSLHSKEESSESEQSSEEEQESPIEDSTDEEEQKSVKKPVNKPVSKAVPKQQQKPKPKAQSKKMIYELSSSSESEEDQPREVKGSNFIRFIRELDQVFEISDKNTILEIYNDVMGFKKSKFYIPSVQKSKLRRYLDKFYKENEDVGDDIVNSFMLNFVNDL